MTNPAELLGLTEDEAAQILAACRQPWVLRRCSSVRPRPADCVQRVVRVRTADDGTVEVTLSGFCDHPRLREDDASGEEQT